MLRMNCMAKIVSLLLRFCPRSSQHPDRSWRPYMRSNLVPSWPKHRLLTMLYRNVGRGGRKSDSGGSWSACGCKKMFTVHHLEKSI